MKKYLWICFCLLLLPWPVWANSLILDATTKSLEMETGSTASTDYAVSYVDNTTTLFTPGLSHGNVAAATTTTILAAPAGSTQRQVKWISIRNRSGAASQTVTLKLDVSATDFHIGPVFTLELGEELLMDAEGHYTLFTAVGLVKVAGIAFDGIIRDGTGDTTQANVTSGRLNVDGSGVTQPVSAASLPLPAGASTSALQDGIIKDGTGDTTQANVSSGRVHVDGSGVTQPVSAASLPLPAGASTSALQDGIIKDGTGDTTQANVSTGRLHVDGSGVTQPVSGTVTVGTFPDNEPFNVAQIVGTAPVAHDLAMSGDSVPLTTAGYAESPEDSDANTSGNRSSADADKQRLLLTRYGEVFVREGGVFKWTYHENSSSALTDTTVHASCGSGLFNYITAITFSTNAATAASVMVEDSTTTVILGPYYLEAIAGRGLHVMFPGGKKQTTAATLIAVTTTGAIAHGLDIQGFCAP